MKSLLSTSFVLLLGLAIAGCSDDGTKKGTAGSKSGTSQNTASADSGKKAGTDGDNNSGDPKDKSVKEKPADSLPDDNN